MRHGPVMRMKWLALLAAIPLAQFAGCTPLNFQQVLLDGVTRTVGNSVFFAAQTVFNNVFGL